jgi:hypothetical protein
MTKLLTIGFDFMENFYYSLIRVKERETCKEYEITVMNGTLERLLYGNHVIREKNGYLQVQTSDNTDQCKLKFQIAEALSKFLQVPLEQTSLAEGQVG